MSDNIPVRDRWVVNHVMEYTIDTAKQISVRFHVPLASVLDVAVYKFYAGLSKGQQLPAGWTPPHDW